jgi:hypothetical protein
VMRSWLALEGALGKEPVDPIRVALGGLRNSEQGAIQYGTCQNEA